MDNLIPVHIGLMGHIDHGKTALAEVLSEKVSTAGLDAHPQSKKRGITIDLGFTMFTQDDRVITLVDSPGHADLIRSVVAGAGIIDGAILVVAADEGPMIQTGEHVIVLRAMGIEHLIVAITKIDLVTDEAISSIMKKMKSIVNGSGFEKVDYVQVSAHTKQGIDELRKCIGTVQPKARKIDAPLFIPIDHAFTIKGHGTVITGTILGGTLRIGQKVQLSPLGYDTRVRSIQTFGEARDSAKAGDRVGVNISEVNPQDIFRGCYLSEDASLVPVKSVYTKLKRNPHYKGRVTFRMIVSATIGMPTVTAELIPVETFDDKSVVSAEITHDDFDCVILLQQNLAVRPGMKVLLMRTDLPPTSMRILASGVVQKSLSSVMLYKKRKRVGRVHRLREHDILVEGLASGKEVAQQLIGARIKTVTGVNGTVCGTFGTRGVLSVQFDTPVNLGDSVIYERLTEEVFEYGSRT